MSLLLGLILFARAVGTLSSAGEVVTEDIWIPPPTWGCASLREPFRDLMLQECKSFGSTSSSMNNLRSQGWSDAAELDNFLPSAESGGGEMEGHLAVQTHTAVSVTPCSPTRVGGHFSRAWASTEGRSVLCIMFCQVEEPQLMRLHAFHSSLPTRCHSITFLCLWGGQGQAWLLSDHVTGHTWGCGHGTFLQ